MFGAEISTYRELKVIAKVISSITSSAHSRSHPAGCGVTPGRVWTPTLKLFEILHKSVTS